MGFVREKKTYAITWAEGEELHGLEIEARSVSIGEYFRVQRLIQQFYNPPDEWQDAEYEANADELLAAFASVLVTWNLEEPLDEGLTAKVPATLAGVRSQDIDLVANVIVQWHQVLSGVHDKEGGDLGKDSTSGEPFAEESIPMVALSPSQ